MVAQVSSILNQVTVNTGRHPWIMGGAALFYLLGLSLESTVGSCAEEDKFLFIKNSKLCQALALIWMAQCSSRGWIAQLGCGVAVTGLYVLRENPLFREKYPRSWKTISLCLPPVSKIVSSVVMGCFALNYLLPPKAAVVEVTLLVLSVFTTYQSWKK